MSRRINAVRSKQFQPHIQDAPGTACQLTTPSDPGTLPCIFQTIGMLLDMTGFVAEIITPAFEACTITCGLVAKLLAS